MAKVAQILLSFFSFQSDPHSFLRYQGVEEVVLPCIMSCK